MICGTTEHTSKSELCGAIKATVGDTTTCQGEMKYSKQSSIQQTYYQPPMDPNQTIVPDFLSLMYGRNARVTLSAPKTLVLPGKSAL